MSRHVKPKRKYIGSFAVYDWLAMLFSISFSATAFGQYGIWSSLGVFVLSLLLGGIVLRIAWQERRDIKSLARISEVIGGIGLVAFLMVIVLTVDMMSALMALLFFAQLGLFMQFAEHRQTPYGPIVSFVALMAGATLSKSTGYIFYMLGFGLCAIGYFSAVYRDKHTPPQQRILEEQSRFLTSMAHGGLLIFVALMTMFIYLLMPRFPAGNIGATALEGWGSYQDTRSFEDSLKEANEDLSDDFLETQNNGGVSSGIDDFGGDMQSPQQCPTPSAESLLSDEIIAYVRSPRPLYLQNQVKTYFDGQSWFALQSAYQYVDIDGFEFMLYPDATVNTEVEIIAAQDIDATILAPNTTVRLEFPSQILGRDYYDGLSIGQALAPETTYRLLLHDKYQHNRLVDNYQAPPNQRDLQLPDDLDPRIAALGAKIVAGQDNDWEKAIALELHLRTQYQYTLSTLPNQNNIPIAGFLFGARKGHCEYFATSLAIMLRQQGIPARMVTGFVADSYNPVTGYYEVKGVNGHAWVNAYLDGSWILLEATGAYATPEEEQEDIRNANAQLQSYIEQAQKEQALLEQPQTLKDWLLMIWHSILQMVQQLWQWLQIIVPIVAIVVIGGFVAWALHKWLYNRYRDRIEDRQDAAKVQKYRLKNTREDLEFYLYYLQRRLARAGVERAAGLPIEQFALEIRHSNAALDAADLQILETLINQHYYQNVPYDTTDKALFMRLYQQAKER